MPGRAKSKAEQNRARLYEAEAHEARAVAAYNKELDDHKHHGGKEPSFRAVAGRFGLDYRLLQRRVLHIGLSKAKSNASKAHLTDTEARELIDFAIEMSYRAFPLTLAGLQKYAEEQVQTRKPDFRGFGKNWAHRFVTKYGDRISTKWGVSLDSIRAKTVTPAAVDHYFDLLEKTLTEHNIQPHNIYGFDESGFPLGGGKKTRVVGPTGDRTQKMQRDGNKENVTVMATICADGTSVPPVVIFKGQYFLEKWRQENPIDAA